MNRLKSKSAALALFIWISVFTLPCQATQTQEPHTPPILTTTAIIEVFQEGEFKGIVLIERGKAPWGKALPGGKVECGETVEEAVRREMMEEVNLDLYDLKQFHVYSDPERDTRQHNIAVVFLAKAKGKPIAGDDAKGAGLFGPDNLPEPLCFDHPQIINDYFTKKY